MATTFNPWTKFRLNNRTDNTYPDVADQVVSSTEDVYETDPATNEQVYYTRYLNASGQVIRIGPVQMAYEPAITACTPSTFETEDAGTITVTITGSFANFADGTVTSFLAIPVLDPGGSVVLDPDIGNGYALNKVTVTSSNATTVVGTVNIRSDQHRQLAGGTGKLFVQIGNIRTAPFNVTFTKVP